MAAPGKNILTINGGSSSIKFALFAADQSLSVSLKGQIARIGTTDAEFSVQGGSRARNFTRPAEVKDHAAAVDLLMGWIEECRMDQGLAAVGHRVVHGGPHLHEPQAVTTALLEQLRDLICWDPEHLPSEIMLIEAFARRFPRLPQFTCFDTAFHHHLPRVARTLPIPRRYEAQGVRRYGFHGLSYEYLMSELVRIDGIPAGRTADGGARGSVTGAPWQSSAARGKIILAHLGNGASLAAVSDGKPMDTSMAFTPAAGMPMGTRSGDLDPGLAGHLARTEGMSAQQFHEMVNFKSGLLGISETSADMRELLLREADDPRAIDAVAVFCYQVRKWIGGFAAVLGGLDTLVFAGGIGEQAALVRARICSGLGYMGVALDPSRNERNADLISAGGSGVKVRVIRTNEELVIARAVSRLLGGRGGAADLHAPS